MPLTVEHAPASLLALGKEDVAASVAAKEEQLTTHIPPLAPDHAAPRRLAYLLGRCSECEYQNGPVCFRTDVAQECESYLQEMDDFLFTHQRRRRSSPPPAASNGITALFDNEEQEDEDCDAVGATASSNIFAAFLLNIADERQQQVGSISFADVFREKERQISEWARESQALLHHIQRALTTATQQGDAVSDNEDPVSSSSFLQRTCWRLWELDYLCTAIQTGFDELRGQVFVGEKSIRDDNAAENAATSSTTLCIPAEVVLHARRRHEEVGWCFINTPRTS